MPSEGAVRAEETAQWFELEDDEDEDVTGSDRQFLAVVRERAADGWSCDPDDTFAFHDHQRLRLILTIVDRGSSRFLLAYGLAFGGGRILGDRVHGQTLHFENPTPDRFEAEGSTPYLATAAARWFESILEQPIEHRTWYSFDKLIYEEWAIATTDEVIDASPGRRRTDAPDRVTLVSPASR